MSVYLPGCMNATCYSAMMVIVRLRGIAIQLLYNCVFASTYVCILVRLCVFVRLHGYLTFETCVCFSPPINFVAIQHTQLAVVLHQFNCLKAQIGQSDIRLVRWLLDDGGWSYKLATKWPSHCGTLT